VRLAALGAAGLRFMAADGTASLELALNVAGYFDIDDSKARKIAKEVGLAVARWRAAAAKAAIKDAEIESMASAFEHADLKNAVKGK
jgi:serine/threonine-protein kinase HipA